MKKIHAAVLLVSVILPLSLFIIFSSLKADLNSEIKEEVVVIKTAQVEHESISIPVRTAGILSSKTTLKLSFKIGGIVEKLFAEEGDAVKKGDLLARLDLAEIEAQLKQAQSSYAKAERDHNRIKKLYDEKVATLEQLQNVETGLRIAQSQLEIALFNRRHSEITAPSDGTILKRFVESGELLGQGNPVYVFGSTGGSWIIRAGISDRDIVRVALKDSAEISFDAYTGKTFTGIVSEIAESADQMSGTFEIEITVNSGSSKMISGFTGTVKIFPEEKKTYSIVPIDAIVDGDRNMAYVYIPDIKELKAIKVPVSIVEILRNHVAINSEIEGLKEVITDGAPYLYNGAKIVLAKK